MATKIFGGFVIALLATLVYFSVFSEGLGKAPDLTLQAPNHAPINLSMPKKPILVNFWATTCPGCVAEMPQLAELKQRLGDKLTLVAISMNYDPAEQVQNFIAKNQYPFEFIMDTDGQYAQAFGGINLTPTSFLIAPNGNIKYLKIGTVDFNQIETLVTQMTPEF